MAETWRVREVSGNWASRPYGRRFDALYLYEKKVRIAKWTKPGFRKTYVMECSELDWKEDEDAKADLQERCDARDRAQAHERVLDEGGSP